MDILQRIAELRDERGWSNYKLAKEAGLDSNSLNNLFRRNSIPEIPTVENICKAFGISLSVFFAENNEAVVLTDDQQNVLHLFNMLSEENKDICIQLMKKASKTI